MKRFIAFFAGLLLLVNCSSLGVFPYHYTHTAGSNIALKTISVWIDGEFGNADLLAIEDAINQWNFALNGFIKIEVAGTKFNMETDIIKRVLSGEGWLILKASSNDQVVKNANRQDNTLAFADEIGGSRIVLIRDRMHNDWVVGITMHEIGHLLGANHDEAYLMAPHYSWKGCRCVDYEALKMVANYRHLPLDSLNYCVYEN